MLRAVLVTMYAGLALAACGDASDNTSQLWHNGGGGASSSHGAQGSQANGGSSSNQGASPGGSGEATSGGSAASSGGSSGGAAATPSFDVSVAEETLAGDLLTAQTTAITVS